MAALMVPTTASCLAALKAFQMAATLEYYLECYLVTHLVPKKEPNLGPMKVPNLEHCLVLRLDNY